MDVYQNQTSNTGGDAGTIFSIILTVIIIVAILQIVLFFKIWIATNDINKLKNRASDPFDDMRFWMRAKYESDKRSGVINDADIDAAEKFIEGDES